MPANEETSTIDQTLLAQSPLTFGIGSEGELVIGWTVGEAEDGRTIRLYVVIPAGSIESLRHYLQETQTSQEMLAAKPPTQSSH